MSAHNPRWRPPPPQHQVVHYVPQPRPQSATRTTAKAGFWVLLLGIGIPMLLCVLGCVGMWVFAVATDDLPPPGTRVTSTP